MASLSPQSWVDIYTLCSLGFPIKFVAKSEIFFIPVCGWAMRGIGHVPLHRAQKGSGSNVVETCTERVRAGVPIFFFPEGTRTKDGTVSAFKTGAFRVAIESDCRVVPITITGTGSMMPAGDNTSLYEGTPTVTVHPAIHASEAGQDPVKLAAMVRESIISGIPPEANGDARKLL
jgi:1-acyl-sn-glycerol-3-phosphate acyltransferase